jgi:hypothetical protein
MQAEMLAALIMVAVLAALLALLELRVEAMMASLETLPVVVVAVYTEEIVAKIQAGAIRAAVVAVALSVKR